MPKYHVEGIYQIPEWWDIDVEAEDELDAETQALDWVQRTAPNDAVDFDILDTKELDA